MFHLEVLLRHLKVKILLGYIGTQLVMPNHWLVTQRMNMLYHALERYAAAVRQLSNGTNGDDLYIHGSYSNGREHYSDS